jgi:DNA-directed RNA polymerase specialized sigma24 family protein
VAPPTSSMSDIGLSSGASDRWSGIQWKLRTAQHPLCWRPLDNHARCRWIAAHVLPYESELRGWLRRRLGVFSANNVDDLVQDAFTRTRAADFCTIRNGRAYLYATIRHLLAEHARHSHIVPIELLGEIDALSILSEDARTGTSGGCPVDGLSVGEIAQRMGLSKKTIENHFTRALARIALVLATAASSLEPMHSEWSATRVDDTDRGIN